MDSKTSSKKAAAPVPKPKGVSSKDLLMTSLTKFYSPKDTLKKIADIVDGKSKISLRLIDWFVTNYSKKKNTVITQTQNNNILHFSVYLSYRSQLKAYSKQLFDPFRRRDRIVFGEGEHSVETTIGQLNFFRWVLQNNILEYVEKNYKEIEADMIKVQKENQQMKNDDANIRVKEVMTETGVVLQKRKKRSQLSKSNVKNMNLLNGHRIIQFD